MLATHFVPLGFILASLGLLLAFLGLLLAFLMVSLREGKKQGIRKGREG